MAGKRHRVKPLKPKPRPWIILRINPRPGGSIRAVHRRARYLTTLNPDFAARYRLKIEAVHKARLLADAQAAADRRKGRLRYRYVVQRSTSAELPTPRPSKWDNWQHQLRLPFGEP